MGEAHIQKMRRLSSIDALRGLVMLFMLLDHVRETVFLHMQVGDPVDVFSTSPSLVFLRFLSSFCAPAFVLLTGLGAYLYSQKYSKRETSMFLLKRGLILILLEVIVIGYAWTGVFPPEKLYLQIIWCIGICMIALSGLIHLPRFYQIVLSLLIICGHNLLDPIKLDSSHMFHVPWAILHQRDWIEVFGVPARTSYPVLAWVGIILGGFALGRWFTHSPGPSRRQNLLLKLSFALFSVFLVVRAFNFYGDKPWSWHDSFILTSMEFFTLTKYPPSFLFTTLTLAFAVCALAFFEKWENRGWLKSLAKFGSGAMFFYVLHLYLLKGVYLLLASFFGQNQGDYYGVDHPYQVVLWTLLLSVPLWMITIRFVRFKERHRGWKWLSYF